MTAMYLGLGNKEDIHSESKDDWDIGVMEQRVLHSCNVVMLQSCKVAKYQSCNVAMLQCCKVAK